MAQELPKTPEMTENTKKVLSMILTSLYGEIHVKLDQLVENIKTDIEVLRNHLPSNFTLEPFSKVQFGNTDHIKLFYEVSLRIFYQMETYFKNENNTDVNDALLRISSDIEAIQQILEPSSKVATIKSLEICFRKALEFKRYNITKTQLNLLLDALRILKSQNTLQDFEAMGMSYPDVLDKTGFNPCALGEQLFLLFHAKEGRGQLIRIDNEPDGKIGRIT